MSLHIKGTEAFTQIACQNFGWLLYSADIYLLSACRLCTVVSALKGRCVTEVIANARQATTISYCLLTAIQLHVVNYLSNYNKNVTHKQMMHTVMWVCKAAVQVLTHEFSLNC